MVKTAHTLFFLLVLVVASQPEQMFRVNTFVPNHKEPLPPDPIIKGAYSEPLLPLFDVPESLKPGEIIKRVKSEEGYTLYLGHIDTTAFHFFPQYYYYDIPSWSSLKSITAYRFYRSVTDNYNLDEEVVYFDNERIYASQHEQLFFLSENAWHALAGSNKNPTGSLYITSTPPGADVFLFGQETGFQTPCTIRGLISGDYEIELFLEKHRFNRRRVPVAMDRMVSISFELLSDFEAVHIVGESTMGRLILPYPPINQPFFINDSAISANQATLPEGKHHLKWNGVNRYRSLDTTVYIHRGKLHYFNLPYERLYGRLNISTQPSGVMVCIEDHRCQTGPSTFTLASGFYTLGATKRGYGTETRKVMVSPDVISQIQIVLEPDLDRDGDGFPDSVDRCPDVWGLFNGCPRMHIGDAFYIKADEVREFVRSDPFSFGFSAIGIVSRSASRRSFSEILSDFSGERIGAVNNYKGFTALNMFHLSWRGMLAQIELGQWSTGLRYRRSDTLTLRTENETYIAYYDSLANFEPVIYLPSTAVSFGLRYQLERFSVSYSLGYQWEDIIFDQLMALSDNSIHRITFDNDWWFHQLQLRYNFASTHHITPSAYFRIKFPFGAVKKTRWNSVHTGLQLDFTDIFRRKEHGEE